MCLFVLWEKINYLYVYHDVNPLFYQFVADCWWGFTHDLQGCFTDTRDVVWLLQARASEVTLKDMGKIDQDQMSNTLKTQQTLIACITRYVEGTPMPKVTPVPMWYIHTPHHGHMKVHLLVMNGLASLPFHVYWPSHSSVSEWVIKLNSLFADIGSMSITLST